MYGVTVNKEPPKNAYTQMNYILQGSHLEKQNPRTSAIIGPFSGKPLYWSF